MAVEDVAPRSGPPPTAPEHYTRRDHVEALVAPLAVDADVVHLAGTETIDGVKTFGSAPLVPVGSLPANPVRRDDTRLTDARAPTAHDHPAPLVPNPPVTLAYTTSNTPDATVGNYRVCTMTGNMTLNPPANPADGQLWRLRVIASGAVRTVTFAAGLRRPASIASTLDVPSGRRGDVGLLYEAADTAWTVLAAQAA